MSVTAHHDRDVDAIYVRLSSAPIDSTVEVDGVVLDLDVASNVTGLELLSVPVDSRKLESAAHRFGFADVLGEVQAAIAAAMPPRPAYSLAWNPVTLTTVTGDYVWVGAASNFLSDNIALGKKSGAVEAHEFILTP